MKKNKILFILLNGFILYSTTLLISENIPYCCKILTFYSHCDSCNYAFNSIPSLSENMNSLLYFVVNYIVSVLYNQFSLPFFIIFKDVIIMLFLLKKFKYKTINSTKGRSFILGYFFCGMSIFSTLLVLTPIIIDLIKYPQQQYYYESIKWRFDYWVIDLFLIFLEAIIVDIIIVLIYENKLLESKIKIFKDN